MIWQFLRFELHESSTFPEKHEAPFRLQFLFLPFMPHHFFIFFFVPAKILNKGLKTLEFISFLNFSIFPF